MIVYIYPRWNQNLETKNSYRAGNIEKAIENIPVNKIVHDELMNANKSNDQIIIHSELDFTVDDIPENWAFGNGTTCSHIKLNDGRVIPVVFIVVESSLPQSAIDNMITKIKENT